MRVLVVDDTADVRLLVVHALGAFGYEVFEASGGARALEMLDGDGPPDVVLLDIQMPIMDGWETLERIRRNGTTAHIPVIMFSVKGSDRDLVDGWRLGCDGYVTKPFDIVDLAREVNQVMQRTPHERASIRLAELERLSRDSA